MAEKSAILTLGYTNTDFTRKLTISGVADSFSFNTIEQRAIAVNESLAAGTAGGLEDFFLADDYDDSDPQNIKGKLNRITNLRVETITETKIF